MSKIFYDHLIIFEEVEAKVKESARTEEERDELWQIIDDTIHNRVMGVILDKLPREFHEEFLDRFHKAPYDEQLMMYLSEKISRNFEEILRQELGNLATEILKEIQSAPKSKSK